MNVFTARKKVREHLEPMIARKLLTLDMEVEGARFRVTGGVPNLNHYLFTGPRADYDCFYHFDIVFPLGVIPSHCQERCWKVVINVNSVSQVYELYQYLKANEIMGKAGCDTRPYTYGYWRGFCYHYDSESALDTRDALREVLPELLTKAHPAMPVHESNIFVKHGCTEFELQESSENWSVTKDTELIERILAESVEESRDDYLQTEWMEANCLQKWIEQAYAIGDHTWEGLARKLFSVGKDIPVVLYRPSTQYERDEEEADGEGFVVPDPSKTVQ